VKAPSRGGSSRGGSSGKSSRSSSRDIARDGDISSRCSSGCWGETDTNSSDPSRPQTPSDVIPSPLDQSKGLLMPDPIRTALVIPPALLADEHSTGADSVRVEDITKTERAEPPEASCAVDEGSQQMTPSTCESMPEPMAVGQEVSPDARPGVSVGMPLKWDPFGRDGTRRPEVKNEWSPDRLATYLRGVAMKIDTNLRDGRLPTAEQFDTFVFELVRNSQRQLKNSPKKVRHRLQTMFALRFKKFWDFARNEKVRSITAEELKWILTGLVENLTNADFPVLNTAELQHPLVQPKPLRAYSYGQAQQLLRPQTEPAVM